MTERAGIGLLYQQTSLPQNQVMENIASLAQTAGPERKLNLFLPRGPIFVHDGNRDSENKDPKFDGMNVYWDIGRFFASPGIGVAVVDSRLQPIVTWRTVQPESRSDDYAQKISA